MTIFETMVLLLRLLIAVALTYTIIQLLLLIGFLTLVALVVWRLTKMLRTKESTN